jgi:hypothetical protein
LGLSLWMIVTRDTLIQSYVSSTIFMQNSAPS